MMKRVKGFFDEIKVFGFALDTHQESWHDSLRLKEKYPFTPGGNVRQVHIERLSRQNPGPVLPTEVGPTLERAGPVVTKPITLASAEDLGFLKSLRTVFIVDGAFVDDGAFPVNDQTIKVDIRSLMWLKRHNIPTIGALVQLTREEAESIPYFQRELPTVERIIVVANLWWGMIFADDLMKELNYESLI